MKSLHKLTLSSLTLVLLLGLGGCADMSRRDRNTALGAVAGAAVGSVLTNGDALGTVGGAVVGGVIGNDSGRRR
jgi:osmotically inducible lipoprotein OsmB